MNNHIVELKDVIKIYHRGTESLHAVDSINLAIQEGDFVSIIGPSGSGKSTLLNLIGCVDKPTSGTVKIDNIEASKLREKGLARVRNEKIGFVFQQFFLLPTLTALENVELPTLFNQHKRVRKKQLAKELLETVDLKNRINHLPSQLSGGEMQRVAIARALINSPKILLADEPTGNLDSKNAYTIIDIFRKLNREGLTIIIVTHNLELAKSAEKVFEIRDGRLKE